MHVCVHACMCACVHACVIHDPHARTVKDRSARDTSARARGNCIPPNWRGAFGRDRAIPRCIEIAARPIKSAFFNCQRAGFPRRGTLPGILAWSQK
jgi:hypothetical protein